MSHNSDKSDQKMQLSEEERARIRSEMRYAMLVTQETPAETNDKSIADKIFGFLNNGFILLLVGSLITSILVPHFQQEYESRTKQTELMQECLSQFLVYRNSIWHEYYKILPLTQEVEIDKKKYLQYTGDIAKIKLDRYNSFAKVSALANVFRKEGSNTPSQIEVELKQYAIQLNTVSASIDKWLRSLYCTPTARESSPCTSFDLTFDSFSEYEKIKSKVIRIGNNESDNVAANMVKIIKAQSNQLWRTDCDK